ncbi:uncharacterized protein LOC128129017 [Lactuca sativa]|uniref:uncharacterized protein LOC128129017 n=1 Tax=Lactuca sativa TaxID=4236 RepID=UPI000CD7FD28|nr:uncharacterized protein LOC128129017 [Lactuca sativa]
MKKMALVTDFAKELDNNRKRCLEIEKKSILDEIGCLILKAEVENLQKRNKELEEQIARFQKVMINEEKGKMTIIDLTCEENEKDEFLRLTIKNKVLEREKAKAEIELRLWKEKVKKLVSQVCEFESKLNMKGMNENCSKVKKRLPFEDDGSFNKNIAPSIPGFAPPLSSVIIDISDEDVSYDDQIPKVQNHSNSILKNADEDHTDCFKLQSQVSIKRKRSCRIVASEDETSDDDDAPICTLIKKVKEDESIRQPLKKLRKLDDIILDSANGSNEFKVTLNKIRSKKDLNLKWDLEGDMLADSKKDPELCMKAVCVLYKQQTKDEKECNGTLHQNARGFSQTNVLTASKVAEIFTDGDSSGDLNKTVEELRRYDTKGSELCMTLAFKYSKQLFEIYKNKEDPFFMP